MPKSEEESWGDNLKLKIFVFDLGSPEDADTPTFNAGRGSRPYLAFGLYLWSDRR